MVDQPDVDRQQRLPVVKLENSIPQLPSTDIISGSTSPFRPAFLSFTFLLHGHHILQQPRWHQ
jgi:hypothetical protein